MKPHLIALLLLGLAGCGSDSTGPSTASMTGQWAGHGSRNGVVINVFISLTEDADSVYGTGSISGTRPLCNLAIRGDRSGGGFDLGLKCEEYQPFTYSGRVHSTTLQGTFRGSGIDGIRLVLTRTVD